MGLFGKNNKQQDGFVSSDSAFSDNSTDTTSSLEPVAPHICAMCGGGAWGERCAHCNCIICDNCKVHSSTGVGYISCAKPACKSAVQQRNEAKYQIWKDNVRSTPEYKNWRNNYGKRH